MQQWRVGELLADWLRNRCVAAVRLQLDATYVYLDECDVPHFEGGFVIVMMTPSSRYGAST